MSWRKIIGFVFCAGVWISVAHAQTPYPDRPIDLRVTGTLLPPEEQQREDIPAVNIFVQGNPLFLRIGKVEDLTTTERAQVIKYEVLLQKVRFTGPEALMQRLQQPEMRGRVLTIEGWLKPRQKRFQVTSVEEAAETPSTSQ